MKSIISFFTANASRTLVLAILWTALIFFACFIPGNEVPKVKIFQLDKLVHIVLFAGCSCLWTLGLFRSEKKIAGGIWIFLLCLALGVLVELIQSSRWVDGRSGDFWDVIADGVGALLGLWIARLLLTSIKKNRRK